MGDEGSGYDVGRKMLRAAVRAADGRDAPTQLTGMVLEYWRLRELDQVVEAVYSGEKGKSEIADLAPLCELAYQRGDRAALRITREAAGSLAELAAAAAKRLWPPKEENAPTLRKHFNEALEKKRPGVQLASKLHSAEWGCAALAWEKVGAEEKNR